MSALLLAMAAALAWGVADFGAGLKARGISVLVVVSGMLLVGAVAAGATLALSAGTSVESRTVVLGLLAGGVTAVGLAALYRALAIGPMSIVAPISAGGVIIPVIAGLGTGDRPSGLQILGIAAAITGMMVVVSRNQGGDAPPDAGGSRTEALVLAVVGAVGLGIYYLTADGIVSDQGRWYLLIGQLSAGLVLALAVGVRRIPLPGPRDIGQISLLGLLGFGAWALSTAAVQSGALSLTATVASLYPLVTVILAVTITGEMLDRIQLGGLVATFAGVMLIAGGG